MRREGERRAKFDFISRLPPSSLLGALLTRTLPQMDFEAAIKIKHHYINVGDTLLAPSTSTSPDKAGTLIFPSSLQLNEYCYAILKAELGIKRMVG